MAFFVSLKQKMPTKYTRDFSRTGEANPQQQTNPEDYYFSPARNYAGLDYELEVIILDLF